MSPVSEATSTVRSLVRTRPARSRVMSPAHGRVGRLQGLGRIDVDHQVADPLDRGFVTVEETAAIGIDEDPPHPDLRLATTVPAPAPSRVNVRSTPNPPWVFAVGGELPDADVAPGLDSDPGRDPQFQLARRPLRRRG